MVLVPIERDLLRGNVWHLAARTEDRLKVRPESAKRTFTLVLPRPWTVGRALTALVASLVVADLVLQTVDAELTPEVGGWSKLVRFFDLGSEASLATWLTIVALVACAALLTLIALAEKAAATRLTHHWAALAVIAAGMSVNERAQFHDAGLNPLLREHLGLGGLLYQGWVVIAFASALVVLLTYRRFLLVLPSTVRRALLLAGALYVAGEAGMEMIGG